MSSSSSQIEIQRAYYAKTAEKYDGTHINKHDEHFFALTYLAAMLDYLEIYSVLDVGSGTGRAVSFLKQAKPSLRVVGIEPSADLRRIGYSKGLREDELIDGDATDMRFGDNEFDLVCEFGVLHHIQRPECAVSEMLRVANRAIFISDSNNFGQGTPLVRLTKQILNSLGLWKLADFLKTKGRGYSISEGDGLAYSYSVFNNYNQISHRCECIHLLNTKDGHIDFYRTASHVALLGIKNKTDSVAKE